MRDDLIFHITTKDSFFSHKKDNNYSPESLEEEGFIHCSKGRQVEETANSLFSDQDQILLLVIDVSTLAPDVKYEEDPERGEKFPHIYGPLNTDAIMDKLNIHAEKDGQFKINFSVQT